jgi:competence protein CoiA
MQFALVENTASEPAPGLRGICRSCGMPMIAKCGRHKLWHWAHKSRMHCDPWWESETEWHREWKNKFPKDWHESVHVDPATGEKHIADVKTGLGLVVEFQHSPMTSMEMKSREDFYNDMVWIVDGCRGELDSAHFNMGLGGRINESPVAHSFHWYGRSKLFRNWINATKPVLIDFGGANLWQLVTFNPSTKQGVVGPGGKEFFIQDFIQGNPLARIIR